MVLWAKQGLMGSVCQRLILKRQEKGPEKSRWLFYCPATKPALTSAPFKLGVSEKRTRDFEKGDFETPSRLSSHPRSKYRYAL